MRVKDNLTMNLPYQSQRYDWPSGWEIKEFSSWYVSQVMGFDIETKGLDPYNHSVYIISFAVSPEDKVAGVQGVTHNGTQYASEQDLSLLQSIIENPKITLIGHNIKFDLKWLLVKYGWQLRCKVFDTMLASYLIDENLPASLEDCIIRFLGEDTHKEMVLRKDLEQEHINDVLLYNAYDAETVKRIATPQMKALTNLGMRNLAKIAMRVLPVLTKMEVRGVCIDTEWSDNVMTKMIHNATNTRTELAKVGLSKPDSDIQLRDFLFKVMKFKPIFFTDTGNASTSGDTIKYLKDQTDDVTKLRILDKILSYKKDIKLLTTNYQPIKGWLAYDQRVHTSYQLGKQYGEGDGGTVTGRLSSNRPNLQNIPRGKDHRGMFIPSNGYSFIDGDFSQLELRVVAYLSQEPVMIQSFEEGLDIHTAVMSDMTGIPYDEIEERKDKDADIKNQRVAIKRINFGIVYGVGAARLQKLLKLELGVLKDETWCQGMIDKWLQKYDKVALWLQEQRNFAARNKYVAMPFGQRRRLPDAKTLIRNMDKEERERASRALRQATNFPVQSMASWICLFGLVLIDDYFTKYPEIDGHIVLQVHDSITCEVRKGSDLYPPDSEKYLYCPNNLIKIAKDIQDIMEKDTIALMKDHFGIKFNVPLEFPTKVLSRWE